MSTWPSICGQSWTSAPIGVKVSQTDPRAKKVKPQQLVDSPYLNELEKSGFFDQLWAGKK